MSDAKRVGDDILRQAFGEMPDRPTLGKHLGFQYDEIAGDRVVLRLPITEHVHQPFGIVHGGAYAVIAEEVASIGGQMWLGDRGHVVGTNNNTDFLRAIREGTIRAVGTPVHQGRTQQLWRIEMRDDHDRLVATSQVRLANITDPGRLGHAPR